MKWLDNAENRVWNWYYGQTVRRLVPAPVYVTYYRRLRIVAYVYAAAMIANLIAGSSPVVREAAIAISIIAGAAYLAIGIPYVLAWDELQRRALAEAGAIAAAATAFLLMSATLLEKIGLRPLPAVVWLLVLLAAWYIALPLVRRHYEA